MKWGDSREIEDGTYITNEWSTRTNGRLKSHQFIVAANWILHMENMQTPHRKSSVYMGVVTTAPSRVDTNQWDCLRRQEQIGNGIKVTGSSSLRHRQKKKWRNLKYYFKHDEVQKSSIIMKITLKMYQFWLKSSLKSATSQWCVMTQNS